MSDPTIQPPDGDDILEELKAEIFATLNCVQVGRVEEVNAGENTVSVRIQIKRRLFGGQIQSYPVLLDCPFFVLQGGTGYISMPVASGDYCLVLFNDRAIDTWFDTGAEELPPSRRKHSLSDGFALVGIQPRSGAREIDSTVIGINNPQGVDINGNDKRFVTFAELNTALQGLVNALNTHTHIGVTTGGGTSGTPSPPPFSLDITAAETQTVKTGG